MKNEDLELDMRSHGLYRKQAVKKHRLGCLSDAPTCSFPAMWLQAHSLVSEPVSLSRNEVKKDTGYIEDL